MTRDTLRLKPLRYSPNKTATVRNMWVTYGWHITPHYFILQDTLLNLLIMQGHSRYINTYGTHNYRKCIYKCINIISHVYILFFPILFSTVFSRTFRKPLQTDQIRFGHRRSLCETVDLRGQKTGGDFGMGKKRGSTHLAFSRGKNRQFFISNYSICSLYRNHIFFFCLETSWNYMI